jgi:hypothetical protein
MGRRQAELTYSAANIQHIVIACRRQILDHPLCHM